MPGKDMQDEKESIGMEGFGASAPAPELFKHFGFSDENGSKIKAMINR